MLNDVYELTLHQTDRGQEMNNVFFFHQVLEFVTTNPTKAQALAEGFRDQWLDKISDIQPEEIVTTGVTVRNLFDVSDAYDLALSVPGDFLTDRELESTFNAIGFQLNGDNPAVKNGAKRFGGVFEDYVNDGVITGASLITPLTALGNTMQGFVTVGTLLPDNVFRHVIVKRIREGAPGAYTYRLPANQLESTLSAVVVALFNAVITSQLSRKIGVGI